MDKLRALEYFIKVAETKSFSASASTFGVPASSVSRRIQDLEAALGVTLLTRTTRVVRLTELGELYFEQVSKTLSKLRYADELVKDRPTAPSGRLRITSTPGYGSARLMPALRKLRRQFPDLILDVELTDQVSNLSGEDVDLAVRATSEPPERAIARKLANNTFMLVASPAYLTQFGTPQKLNDIAQHKSLLYRGPGRILQWQAKTAHGWVDLETRPTFISNAGAELLDEALAGGGIALLPHWSVQELIDRGQLHKITLMDAQISVSRTSESWIYLLYHQPKYRLKKIKAAVDFLIGELGETA